MSAKMTKYRPRIFASAMLGIVVILLASCIQAAPIANTAAMDCAQDSQQMQDLLAFAAPAGEQPAQIDKAGTTIIPNGRLITPAGKNVVVAPHPYGLTLSPDGSVLATANSGTEPFSISIVTDTTSAEPIVRQLPEDAANDPSVLEAVFMGLAITPDNRTLYAAGGNSGSILVFDLQTMTRTATIDLNVSAVGRDWKDSYIGDLKLSPDGKMVWAVDQANFRLVGVDLATQTVTKVAPTGRYPFGVALTPDGALAYVANIGMYEYSFVEGYDRENVMETGLSFPPFAQGSEEAMEGTTIDGKVVPGLGDPNAPESFSVWAIDLASSEPITMLKTGPLVGEIVEAIPAVGGSSPNSVVTDGKRVYVANNHSDTVAVIDIATNSVTAQIPLDIPDWRLSKLRGIMPFGVALSPDYNFLYVAESGINAVAVIDTRQQTVIGHIPVGWFPSKLAVAPDGSQLYVANAKGYGSGPNGGPDFVAGPEGTYIGSIQKGTVSFIDLPDFTTEAGQRQLQTWTQQVLENNGFIARSPVPQPTICSTQVKHVIFITKENRTYDEVFGDLGLMGNREVNGVAEMARYGEQITPNHHALVRQFAHSDNFYVDSDVSADGHRWLVGVAPDEFVETSWAASYGGQRDFRYEADTAPGRLGFTEANAALAPEDYPEAGSLWEHLYRNGIEFYNYGEGFEFSGISGDPEMEPTGARLPTNVPMPSPLFERTSRVYPTYNMNISDQYRADVFEQDFMDRYMNGDEELPPFVNIYLPGDHTAGPKPEAGWPTRESYVADNDLALGRLVDLISHSKYWESTVIFVTEDDAQDGMDHIDAHRSLLLVISPWAKHNYVSGDHSSMISIIKMINLLTGAPALNLFDAAAPDLFDMFTTTPDFTPYTVVPIDPAIFDPTLVKRGDFTAEELAGSPELDNPADMMENHRQVSEEETPSSN